MDSSPTSSRRSTGQEIAINIDPMGLNDELAADMIRGDLAIQMSVAETNAAVRKVLDELQHDLELQLLNAPSLTETGRTNISQLKTSAARAIHQHIGTVQELTDRDLAAFAQEASLQFIDSVQEHLGDFNPTMLNANDLRSIAAGNAINGTPTSEWWKGQRAATVANFSKKINLGILEGQSNEKLVRLIKGTKAANFSDGIMKGTRAQIKALVRTSVSSVANKSRQMTFEQNADVIKGVRHLSTLDGRTSPICIARSGATYELNKEGDYVPVGHGFPFAGGPPYHVNCRSTMVPVTRSWAELSQSDDSAVKAKLAAWKPTPSTQASMDGQVPENLTWAQFADKKGDDFLAGVIGRGKAGMVSRGEISLADLIDQQGNVRSLSALQKLTKSVKVIEPADIRSVAERVVKAATVTRDDAIAELIAKADEPSTVDAFGAWKLIGGNRGGTRGGIRWDQSQRQKNLGDFVVEVDVEQLRAQHRFIDLQEVKLTALKDATKLDMPSVDLDDFGQLVIVDGQHRVLTASARGIERILVSVPEESMILAKIEQAKKLKKKLQSNRKLSEHPLGREDIVSFFWSQPIQNRGAFKSEFGRMNRKLQLGDRLSEKEMQLRSQFDDMPERKELGNFAGVFKADKHALAPDEAAQMAFNAGMIDEPTLIHLYGKIAEDIAERRTLTKRVVSAADDALDEEGALLDAAQKSFEKKLVGPKSKAPGTMYLDDKVLTVGDVVQADGELFRVIDKSEFGMVLNDGPKYGEVYLPAGKKLKSQAFLSQDIGVQHVPKDVIKAEALQELSNDATLAIEAIRSEQAALVAMRAEVGNAPRLDKLLADMDADIARHTAELKAISKGQVPAAQAKTKAIVAKVEADTADIAKAATAKKAAAKKAAAVAEVGKHSQGTLEALDVLNAVRARSIADVSLATTKQLREDLAKFTKADLVAIVKHGTQFSTPATKAKAIDRLVHSIDVLIGDRARTSFAGARATQKIGKLVLREPKKKAVKAAVKKPKKAPAKKAPAKKAAAKKAPIVREPATEHAKEVASNVEELKRHADAFSEAEMKKVIDDLARANNGDDLINVVELLGLSRPTSKAEAKKSITRLFGAVRSNRRSDVGGVFGAAAISSEAREEARRLARILATKPKASAPPVSAGAGEAKAAAKAAEEAEKQAKKEAEAVAAAAREKAKAAEEAAREAAEAAAREAIERKSRDRALRGVKFDGEITAASIKEELGDIAKGDIMEAQEIFSKHSGVNVVEATRLLSRSGAAKVTWIKKSDALLKFEISGASKGWKADRFIAVRRGKLTATHDTFKIKDGLQGQGLAKEFLSDSLDLYDAMGVTSIELKANIDVGGYAWVRYGFLPDELNWDILKDDIKRKLFAYPEDLQEKALAILAKDDPKAIRELAALKGDIKVLPAQAKHLKPDQFGKQLLLGTTWNGSIDLTDPKAYATFRAYLDKGKAKP